MDKRRLLDSSDTGYNQSRNSVNKINVQINKNIEHNTEVYLKKSKVISTHITLRKDRKRMEELLFNDV